MANNQYVNKVEFGNETIMDISSDTVTSDVLLTGYTAHDRSGAPISGSLSTFVQSGSSAAAGLVPAPSTTAGTTAFLCEDGSWKVPVDTTYSAMTGASVSANGTSGLVPAPTTSDTSKFLKGDGTWAEVDAFPAVTSSDNGKVLEVSSGEWAIGNKKINKNYDVEDDWQLKTWNGLTTFYAGCVWTDGENIYYSYDSSQYILDKSTSTWSEKTWNGLTELGFKGYDVWTDGENIYCEDTFHNQYVLDKATSTWSEKIWNLSSISGDAIWTDGENTYYSDGTSDYVLDKANSIWLSKTWSGLTILGAVMIWSDGENMYYSLNYDQYVLDKSTSTWSEKTWNGLTSFRGDYVWTDGENIYYSGLSKEYVLNKSTSTWSEKNWTGLTSFYGSSVWTDGNTMYYNDWNSQATYELIKHENKILLGQNGEFNVVSESTITPVTMTGSNGSNAGTAGYVPAPSATDNIKFLRGDGTWAEGGRPMVILSYGNSTWTDFINAYNNNVIVYCRASSNSNPASGTQGRMAFMAFINFSGSTPTSVEFQYYRSVSSHSSSQLGDQVFIYKLTDANAWTVITREASIKEVVAGTNIGVSYNSNKVTISSTLSAATTSEDGLMTSSDKTTLGNLETGLSSAETAIDELEDIVDKQTYPAATKNLNVTPYPSTYTTNGMTFTTNADNSVTIDQAPSKEVWWPATNNESYKWLLPAGSYVLSGGVNALAQINLLLFAQKSDTTAATSYSCGVSSAAPVSFTTSQDYWAMVRFYVAKTVTVSDSLTFYPQVEAGSSASTYASPFGQTVVTSRLDTIESDIDDLEEDVASLTTHMSSAESAITTIANKLNPAGTHKFKRTGTLVQYTPAPGQTTTARIDFASTDGFDSITFMHCGENLINMAQARSDGYTKTKNGVTGTVQGSVVHIEGTNTSETWTELFIGYMSSYNYYLPPGHYSVGAGMSIATISPTNAVSNVSYSFTKTTNWQAAQWIASVRGSSTVNWDLPLCVVTGNEVPKKAIPFQGEQVIVTLPSTVYGGWIDINNSKLHITKTLSDGVLVDTTETVSDLTAISLSSITGLNTIYTTDGTITVEGIEEDKSVEIYEEPVADCYLNNDYLQSKIDTINTLARGSSGCDAFFFITDVHVEYNRLRSLPLIREISKQCNIPRLFCGGDISDGYYTRSHEFIDGLKKNYDGEIHYVMGNHEYMNSTAKSTLAYEYGMGKNNHIGNSVYQYYYVDNTQEQIRYIVLASCDNSGSSWGYGYDANQLTWLEQVALNVDTGWTIIVFTHITYDINISTGAKTTIAAAESMFDVLDAYSGNGEIAAVISGHMHCDAVEHTTGGIPVILTTCDKCQPYVLSGTADMDTSIRSIDTISENAFDVFILNKNLKQLVAVRIGCPAWNNVDGTTNGYVQDRMVSY